MTIYPWLLAYYHGTASTGIWAACWGIIAIANPFLLGIQNFLGPKIVQSYTDRNIKEFQHFVIKISAISLLIITPLAIILFFFGGQMVVLFYGNKYSGNGHIISILAINLLVITASFSLSRALLAMEEARLYFMANVLPLIVIITFGIFLVKYLGPTGVALSLVVGYATTAFTMSYTFTVLIRKSIMLERQHD